MKSIEKLFKEKEYYHAFQPICSIPGKERIAYEALLRSKENGNPEVLFQLVKETNALLELDTQSLYYAILTFFRSSDREGGELLFVNIFPSTIVEATFPAFIQEVVRDFEPYLNQIVLEINESIMEGKIWNEPIFLQRIMDLRDIGFLIALDDVGKGRQPSEKLLRLHRTLLKWIAFSPRICLYPMINKK